MSGYKVHRPGLATQAGHAISDSVERTQFFRKSSTPDAVATVHYNDKRGAEAMAKLAGGHAKERTGAVDLANGQLRVRLSNYGDDLPHLQAGNRSIFMAQPGTSYRIDVTNRTKQRAEVIVTVDGLNILTGTAASYQQRGHLIEPQSSVRLYGFRKNDDEVLRFEFGSVADSKAAKAGTARNVGVIGFAMFLEDEAKAKLHLNAEQSVRDDASAFPVQ
jgi:hypothetical protein